MAESSSRLQKQFHNGEQGKQSPHFAIQPPLHARPSKIVKVPVIRKRATFSIIGTGKRPSGATQIFFMPSKHFFLTNIDYAASNQDIHAFFVDLQIPIIGFTIRNDNNGNYTSRHAFVRVPLDSDLNDIKRKVNRQWICDQRVSFGLTERRGAWSTAAARRLRTRETAQFQPAAPPSAPAAYSQFNNQFHPMSNGTSSNHAPYRPPETYVHRDFSYLHQAIPTTTSATYTSTNHSSTNHTPLSVHATPFTPRSGPIVATRRPLNQQRDQRPWWEPVLEAGEDPYDDLTYGYVCTGTMADLEDLEEGENPEGEVVPLIMG